MLRMPAAPLNQYPQQRKEERHENLQSVAEALKHEMIRPGTGMTALLSEVCEECRDHSSSSSDCSKARIGIWKASPRELTTHIIFTG